MARLQVRHCDQCVYLSVCLSVCKCVRLSISVHEHILVLETVHLNFSKFSAHGVAMCYILPVLWMTSCFHTVDPMAAGVSTAAASCTGYPCCMALVSARFYTTAGMHAPSIDESVVQGVPGSASASATHHCLSLLICMLTATRMIIARLVFIHGRNFGRISDGSQLPLYPDPAP